MKFVSAVALAAVMLWVPVDGVDVPPVAVPHPMLDLQQTCSHRWSKKLWHSKEPRRRFDRLRGGR